MRDKIYAYLKSQKAGAASKEIVEQVLKIKGASPHISEKLIQTAIAGDRRARAGYKQGTRELESNGSVGEMD